MKRLLLCLFVPAILACQRIEGGGSSSGKNPQPPDKVDSHIWMSALVYPEGYDWQLDTGAVDPGRVALLCDGEISLLLDDSDSWSDHFVLAGHLYDDGRRAGRTVVRKDGKEFQSWEGEELVWDMALDNGSLYCLCTPLDGTSVSLRKDAVQICTYDGCWPDSRLYEDRGRLCFDVGGKKTGSVCGAEERFIDLSSEDNVISSSSHTMGGETWLRLEYIMNGLLHCTAVGNIDRQPLKGLVKPDEYLGFLYGGKSVLVEKSSGGKYSILRDFETLYESSQAFSRVVAVCDGDDVRALGRTGDGGWVLFSNGELILLPEGTRPSSSDPPAFRYGRLIVPLTLRNGRAAVLDDGKLTALSFNGRVDRVIIGRGSSGKLYLSY